MPVNKNKHIIVVDKFLHGKEMLSADNQEEDNNNKKSENRQDENEMEDKFTPQKY